MSAFVSKLSAVWKLFDAQIRSMLTLPEREVRDFPFVASDIAQLHRLRSDPAGAALDDATWKDMLLDPYSAALSREVSIFGQQVLHQRLRIGMGDTQPGRIQALVDDPAQVKQLHRLCTPLRHADREIATLLYDDVLPLAPAWAGRTWLLPLALLASLAAVALSPLAWLAVFAVLYVLMSTHMRFGDRIEQWQRSMSALQTLLRVVSLQGGEDAAQAGRINRALGRSALPAMRAYADWFALADVKHYFKCAALVRGQLDFLRACFTRIGNLEADLALARHLLQTPAFCWAARSGTGVIALADTVHPLLPQAQPLTLDLKGRGAFISGQNGIGKSTLLRTLGINLIAARAFGFCYAASATLPAMPVYSSMQSEDSLLGGESLYMAELRRARELLAAADGPHPGIYIIDEIFRGTNHLESVSAAASVLDVLAAKGLVVVSSHNLVLAPLLAHRLDPLCVAREPDGTLTLADGVLAHTNGIALLSQRGFGGQVEANAGKVFDWLSAYLAHPADCSAVLST
jgi:hypothetical protein